MSRRWSLKGQNKGASLIAVLTAIVFVGLIGAVITQLTVTNIQMKEVEQQGKKNFYSAEEVMDDLVAGLNNCAALEMQNAYMEILSQYRTVTSSGKSLQAIFKEKYIRNLINHFGLGDAGAAFVNPSTSGMYELGKFKISAVNDCFSNDTLKDAGYLQIAADDANEDWSLVGYRADLKEGKYVLRDIEVTVTDPNHFNYSTTIHTDIVFNAPNLRFDEGNIIRDFMRYSLIANTGISVGASSINVDGNVYAGYEGIKGVSGDAKFVGNLIVCRGDIASQAGGNLMIGDKSAGKAVTLWAENIKTTPIYNSSATAKLKLYGTMFIEDDLELNAKNSEVDLQGKYYGYNFQKQYDGGTPEIGPEYSSTIAINATNTKLTMLGLDTLWVAGRTYISRGTTGSEDVVLGESLSVRSNQLAYIVPNTFVDEPTKKLLDPTGAELSDYLGFSGTAISNYINLSDPVLVYFYQTSGTTDHVYFLKFKSEQAANNFMSDFYNINKSRMDTFTNSYLDSSALMLDAGAITLKGDILYRDGSGDLREGKMSIVSEKWANGGTNYTKAGLWNAKYKSLQLWLEDSHDGILPSTERFTNKSSDPLYGHIINETEFNKLFLNTDLPDYDTRDDVMEVYFKNIDDSITTYDSNTQRKSVLLVKKDEDDTFILRSSIKGGIVVANCNVQVETDNATGFQGLIIAKGNITFSTGAKVSSDEVLVSQLFADDLLRSTRLFTPAFKGYEILNNENIGTINVNKYLTYDNWSKTLK